MSITLTVPDKVSAQPRIVVFGVGGGGCNAVNNMIHSQLEGVDFVAANTDTQSLAQSAADRQIQIGAQRTEGLGAGSAPKVGYEAAEESAEEIAEVMKGSHMVFVTAGMGGGTGTGAAPVIARLARQMEILTVGVVTKPFHFEGKLRMDAAEQGIAELEQFVDTLLVIPNQNLFRVANQETTFADSFTMADRVLHSAVSGITNLITKPGLINLDFADVRAIMGGMGKAMMGTGEAEGEKRGVEAAEAAINNPLLDDVSMEGARGVLISVMGDDNMTLYEVEEATNRVRSEVDQDAHIIFGASKDPHLQNALRVSVVATGIDSSEGKRKPIVSSILGGSRRGEAESRGVVRNGAAPSAQPPAARVSAEDADSPSDSDETEAAMDEASDGGGRMPAIFNERGVFLRLGAKIRRGFRRLFAFVPSRVEEGDELLAGSSSSNITSIREGKVRRREKAVALGVGSDADAELDEEVLDEDDEEQMEIPAFIRRQSS